MLAQVFTKITSGVRTGLNKLNGALLTYTVRGLLVAHIIATSYWPTEYITIFQHLATRVVLAIIVVALLFWDIASGALLAVLLVLSIQEAKSRQLATDVLITGATSEENQIKKQLLSTQETGLVPQSVYGQQQVPQMTVSNEKVGSYMNQIGELGISKQIEAGQGVQIVDGVPSVKVNMDQIGQSLMHAATSEIPTMAELIPLGVGREGYQMNAVPTVNLGIGSAPSINLGTGSAPSINLGTGSAPSINLGTEYDHPANKTISENLRAQATGFITDKNLQDAQINSITGLDGSQPPCFVASQSGIWNAQGFGSIARAVDNEDCPHSFV